MEFGIEPERQGRGERFGDDTKCVAFILWRSNTAHIIDEIGS